MSDDVTAWLVSLYATPEEALSAAEEAPACASVATGATDAGNHWMLAEVLDASSVPALRAFAQRLAGNDVFFHVGGKTECR